MFINSTPRCSMYCRFLKVYLTKASFSSPTIESQLTTLFKEVRAARRVNRMHSVLIAHIAGMSIVLSDS